ncbi:hypothetical protein PBY51_022226 [Eleginops maclovinus]|uniref:Uncharacterized protein n=1 Tax=Eleginops maclovinus TaxID=56733 RepID=A0AAN7XH32_ELEMC|nr:hypothetical protein PBY51_022226 [Eleginops maclovinus]
MESSAVCCPGTAMTADRSVYPGGLFDLAREHLIPAHFLSIAEPAKYIQGIAPPLNAQQDARRHTWDERQERGMG